MYLSQQISGLYTDYYELTMAQGYFRNGMKEIPAVFDYFFRKNPFGGEYVIFAGLADLLEMIRNFRFSNDAIVFLEDQGFERQFLRWLEDFRFQGDLIAVREGEIVFPNEPCIRVEGSIIETQLLETLLLNVINFESLIATKASRIRSAAGDRILMDFGLRRAQGPGGIPASRAAIIGGFQKTSNTYSAFQYGLEPSGTMAHSWIQSFEDEAEAFRAYANLFPGQSILLVDTYDTINSGIPNAIHVAQELEKQGQKLNGIRIDSGDLSYLSKKARKMLDLAGLSYVQIFASNQLDEYIISSLVEQSAPIDGFGVGTAMITGKGSGGALDGVYKLSMIRDQPTLKVSENRSKWTLPGKKELYRCIDEDGNFRADIICLEDEKSFRTMVDPFESEKRTKISHYLREELLMKVMENGSATVEKKSPYEISEFARKRLAQLPAEHKRFTFPQEYKVGISPNLLKSREWLSRKMLERPEIKM
jgi:nicotinate phosphoribosyltransferase